MTRYHDVSRHDLPVPASEVQVVLEVLVAILVRTHQLAVLREMVKSLGYSCTDTRNIRKQKDCVTLRSSVT